MYLSEGDIRTKVVYGYIRTDLATGHLEVREKAVGKYFVVSDTTSISWLGTMKMSLTTSLRDAFLDEFNAYDKLKYKLDIRYRENRHWIEKFFSLKHEEASMAHTVLAKRLEVIEQLSAPLNHLKGDVGKSFDLLSSLSHMYINRLFATSQREHEMVIYYLLTKHYMSSIKQGKAAYSSMTAHQNGKTL